MKKTIILTLFVLISFSIVNAQDLITSENNIDKNNSIQYIKDKFLSNGNNLKNFQTKDIVIDSSKLKSPVLGAVMSAVIPGSRSVLCQKLFKICYFHCCGSRALDTLCYFSEQRK